METFSPIRAAVVFCVIGLFLVGLTGRVAYLQTYGREQTIRKAERQQHQTETLYARRGSIFDANGMLMAGTVQTTSLYVDPKFMQDEFQADGRSLIDMDKAIEKLAAHHRSAIRSRSASCSATATRAASSASPTTSTNDTCHAIEKLKLPGVGLMPMPTSAITRWARSPHTCSAGRGRWRRA